jgi:putative ABC transport system permease protein
MIEIVARVRSLLRGMRRGALQSEMEEEFRAHMALRAADLERAGAAAAEARRRARLEFGSEAAHAEAGRAARGLARVDALRGDVRYALRSLARAPTFALVAIVTLALGIGATTAIFSVLHHTLVRPLPYPAADRLVVLWERDATGERGAVSEANARDWRASAGSLEGLAYHWNPEFQTRHTVVSGEMAARAWVSAVSEDFFEVFDVEAVFGRRLLREEQQAGGPALALISHSFWRQQFGEDPGVVGRPLELLGRVYEVAGVLPAGFRYPAETEVWVSLHRWEANPHRGAKNFAAVGRLRPGATVADAQRELDGIGARLVAEHGAESHAAGASVTPLQEELAGGLRQPLLLLFGAALLLLLIACTNLASSLLARAASRQRELAIRAAIGAQRGRLVRQLLTESAVLALLGTAAGLGVAVLMLRALESVRPASLEPVAGTGVDAPILAFALLLALATTMLFGLMPALRTAASSPGAALRARGRGSSGGAGGGWNALVGVEVALAVVLLAGSGLLLRSFVGVLAEDPGYATRGVLTAEISLPSPRYAEDSALIAYWEQALDAVARVPGVTQAGLIQHVPLGGVSWRGSFDIEGRGPAGVYAGYRVISPGYLRSLGIPLVRGRDFEATDRADAPHVALINESLARQLWPAEDAIGRRIGNHANEPMSYRGPDDWLTIVGVVADVRGGLLEAAEPEVYVNVLQRPDRARDAVLTLRTAAPPTALDGEVRERLRALDARVPVELVPMSERVGRAVAERRFHMIVLGTFALMAVLLAAIGIYGVVAYTVAARTREIGIRLALGAPPARVRALVQSRTLRVVLAGALAGTAAALALNRLLLGMLWGVQPNDPLTFALVLALVGAVAWLASYLPARRSTRVDPLLTMKAE